MKKVLIIISIFFFFIISLGSLIYFLIGSFENKQNEINDNLKLFNDLGGCKSCGDRLIKCPSGDLELLKNDNATIKTICDKLIIKGNYIPKSKFKINMSLN